ncbi:MAG: ABC transporter permease, partial [Betaproteobacteria bacterium]
MNMRWRKVAGDLQLYRLQIGMIALVLVLGTAGVVAALNAQAILKREIAASYATAASPDIALWFDRVEPQLERTIAAEEGVAATGARRVAFARVAARDGTWLPIRLLVADDFATQKLGLVHQHGGAWPAGDGSILIEQSARTLIEADVGGAVRLRTPAGDIVSLPVGGFVHDTAVAPSTQERLIYAYITPGTAARLGQNPALDQLLVKMEHRASAGAAYELGNTLNEALARQGTPALRMEVLPAEHPHAPLMNAMLRVLGVLSAIAFTCSAALAGYMVSAWMRREVRQVGIMKTLGARWQQIAAQYLALVAPTVLVAIALALPLGTLLGRAIVGYYAIALNIDVADWQAPQALLRQEIAFALCIPLIAMILPIVRAARMSPQTAIHDAGIIALSGASRLAARLIRFPGRIRWTFALRNSWRRPWRLMMMMLGLSAGGALLLMTHSNYESFMHVIDANLGNQGHDIEVLLQRPLPAAQLEAIARRVPDVEIAEAWRRAGVNLVPHAAATGDLTLGENRRVTLSAYPPDTRLFRLSVVRGRAPTQGASDEVLVTRNFQDSYPQLQIGSQVDLLFRGRNVPVNVVGMVEEIGAPALYTDFATFDAVTGLGDQSSSVRVKARGDQIE